MEGLQSETMMEEQREVRERDGKGYGGVDGEEMGEGDGWREGWRKGE